MCFSAQVRGRESREHAGRWHARHSRTLRVRLHWIEYRHKTASQHLSGYSLQERVAAFKPTCVSIVIATQGLVLSLLIVSEVNGT